MKLFYDMHIHSCLSPCADDDMTPANIAGMAYLKGLDVVALTDHNSCINCPAFFNACDEYGIVPIAGMELTTAEEIHLICLFPELDSAMSFSDEVKKRLPPIINKPHIFGNQICVGKNDIETGREDTLLINATNMDIYDSISVVKRFNGISYPAHIDRTSNGIIAILGDIPPEPGFTAVEFNNVKNIPEYSKKYSSVEKMFVVCNSDAHSLGKINEAENYIECEEKAIKSILSLF